MKKKNLWLDRTLFMGGYLALVTSQSEFVEALKDIECADYTDLFVPNGWPACTHSFDNVKGSVACIVGLDLERCAEEEPIDVAALLVHEAVHVWQQAEKKAGKLGCFGDEGEAYAIQNISTRLMTAYVGRLK
jgi:hypothetical protein